MSGSLTKSQRDQELAILGGRPSLDYPMPFYSSYGDEEKLAAMKVLETGVLSKFIGAWTEDFYGGPRVQEFEKAWESAFQVKHAVSVNSATSGLMAALGALDLEPGDEVICSPWTMSADAAAILVWNCIPVFADIESETFNLCPKSIEKNISKKTKAILVSDIFGQAAKLDEIMAVARKHKLRVIEDAAQAPGARYHGKFVGTIADIGVYSLNYHKHIHTGEGGVCVTNDSALAERMQLIRNHAESVVSKKPTVNFANMIGFNFRLGEIESALGLEQLKKLPALAQSRTRIGAKLSDRLQGLKGLQTPKVQANSTHVYYVYGLILDTATLGVSRKVLAAALRAEGVPTVMETYQNLHRLPQFQKKIAYGNSHFPWTMNGVESTVKYDLGICPTAEKLYDEGFLGLAPCSHRYDDDDVEGVIRAFEKVWAHLDSLRKYEAS